MNERIQELMEQAMELVDPYALEGDFGPRQLNAEKFAELIVRECAEQCNVNFVGTVGSYPNAHNRGVKMCIDNIKDHFGVE